MFFWVKLICLPIPFKIFFSSSSSWRLFFGNSHGNKKVPTKNQKKNFSLKRESFFSVSQVVVLKKTFLCWTTKYFSEVHSASKKKQRVPNEFHYFTMNNIKQASCLSCGCKANETFDTILNQTLFFQQGFNNC